MSRLDLNDHTQYEGNIGERNTMMNGEGWFFVKKPSCCGRENKIKSEIDVRCLRKKITAESIHSKLCSISLTTNFTKAEKIAGLRKGLRNISGQLMTRLFPQKRGQYERIFHSSAWLQLRLFCGWIIEGSHFYRTSKNFLRNDESDLKRISTSDVGIKIDVKRQRVWSWSQQHNKASNFFHIVGCSRWCNPKISQNTYFWWIFPRWKILSPRDEIFSTFVV